MNRCGVTDSEILQNQSFYGIVYPADLRFFKIHWQSLVPCWIQALKTAKRAKTSNRIQMLPENDLNCFRPMKIFDDSEKVPEIQSLEARAKPKPEFSAAEPKAKRKIAERLQTVPRFLESSLLNSK